MCASTQAGGCAAHLLHCPCTHMPVLLHTPACSTHASPLGDSTKAAAGSTGSTGARQHPWSCSPPSGLPCPRVLFAPCPCSPAPMLSSCLAANLAHSWRKQPLALCCFFPPQLQFERAPALPPPLLLDPRELCSRGSRGAGIAPKPKPQIALGLRGGSGLGPLVGQVESRRQHTESVRRACSRHAVTVQ